MGLTEPHPQVCVVAPSNGSHGFLRRRLLRESRTGFLRCRFVEPEELVAQIGRRGLAEQGLRPEPSGWLETTVAEAIAQGDRELAPEHLGHAGWLAYLANALRRLEGAGMTSERLATLSAPQDPQRVALLGMLLDFVHNARKNAGLFGTADAARSAMAAIEGGTVPLPIQRDQALVAYGDRTLAPMVYDALCLWMQTRPCLRIAFQPQDAAPAASTGLRKASEHGRVVDGVEDDGGPLGRLRLNLFRGDTSGQVPSHDPTPMLRIVRCIDDGREMREVVREVLDALRSGAPADGVAIALPSTEKIHLLQTELDRAGIPASFLVGPALATVPPARALLALLQQPASTLTPKQVHELIQMKSLKRPLAARGSQSRPGRWRRLLVECGLVRGVNVIRDKLRDRREELQADDPESTDIPAIDALFAYLGILDHACGGPEQQTWPEWRKHARDVVDAHLARSPESATLLGVLDVKGTVPSAYVLDREEALTLLRSQLEAEAFTTGSVNQPSVRVVPPLALIGSRFHTVVVPGLTDQSFPASAVGDSILNDTLLSELREGLGCRLEGTEINDELEQRRLAAVVGAASHRLVFTWGKSDMLQGRALQPSPFLTEVVGALGWPRTQASVAAFQKDGATQATGVAMNPSEAVHEAEAVLAHAASRDARAVMRLAAVPRTRRLLQSMVARDRAQAASDEGLAIELDAHTGRIPPELLPTSLWTDPLRPGDLATLIESPIRFLLAHVLGIRRLRRFPTPPDPSDMDRLRDSVRWDLRNAFEAGAPWRGEFESRIRERSEDGAEIEDLSGALDAVRDDWLEALNDVQPTTLPEGAQVHPELPWRLGATAVPVAGGHVVGLQSEKAPKLTRGLEPSHDWELAITGAALASSGSAVTSAVLVRTSSRSQDMDLASANPVVLSALQQATERAQRGLFPLLELRASHRTHGLLVDDVGLPPDARLAEDGDTDG